MEGGQLDDEELQVVAELVLQAMLDGVLINGEPPLDWLVGHVQPSDLDDVLDEIMALNHLAEQAAAAQAAAAANGGPAGAANGGPAGAGPAPAWWEGW